MDKLNFDDLHLCDWISYDENMTASGGSAQTAEALERVKDKINEIIEALDNEIK